MVKLHTIGKNNINLEFPNFTFFLHTGYTFTTFIYKYASLNDGDPFWEMRRLAISSLCERHRVYLHKPK